MTIDKKFIDQFVKVTSKAALATSYFVGKKDKIAADKAATDSMRSELNKINVKFLITIYFYILKVLKTKTLFKNGPITLHRWYLK